MKRSLFILLWIGMFMIIWSCIEEISIVATPQSINGSTDLLVVEAILTDENKNHSVKLSRTSSFSETGTPQPEQNATVTVKDENGNTFMFNELEPGIYVSDEIFFAQTGVAYQLEIITAEGENFKSDFVEISGASSIDDMYAERITNDSGVDGMAIFVDSSSPSGNGRFFRYEYEETYKIIAPNWTAFEFDIIRDQVEVIRDKDTGEVTGILYPDVRLVPRSQEERVCYNTVLSTDILLASSETLNGNSLKRNLVRFIDSENAIISHRYSVLVKQYLHSSDAFDFFNTLKDISTSENLFSQIQPGFIEGNIENRGGTGTKVIGFFDVASISERRLFFDYTDFFPGEPLPPYFGTVNCDRLLAPILGNPERDGPIPLFVNCGEDLITKVKQEKIEFFEANTPGECEGPYYVTQRACGDCTVLGSNIVPEFWIEE